MLSNKRFGRQAFGPGKKRTLAQFAKDVAYSMQQTPGRSLSHYGIQENSEIGQLILTILRK